MGKTNRSYLVPCCLQNIFVLLKRVGRCIYTYVKSFFYKLLDSLTSSCVSPLVLHMNLLSFTCCACFISSATDLDQISLAVNFRY